MRLYVIRHSAAGNRSAWDKPDDLRPLSHKGRRQADAIADMLASAGIDRLVSSPSVRCVQSLEPLAQRLGQQVEIDERLAEGHDGEGALDLAEELRKKVDVAALCSHGDVIPDMLRILKATTARFKEPLLWPKASTWVLTWDGGTWSKARYIPPPEL
ncbi:MAG TPA: phosphoglycerate mutase family protein [Acidimicrobiales bacterium]|jgi:8-oxo-dGTP diphosphatase